MSTPISRSTVIAPGRTEVRRDPADHDLIPPWFMERAIPSAIWRRGEVATPGKRTPLGLEALTLAASAIH